MDGVCKAFSGINIMEIHPIVEVSNIVEGCPRITYYMCSWYTHHQAMIGNIVCPTLQLTTLSLLPLPYHHHFPDFPPTSTPTSFKKSPRLPSSARLESSLIFCTWSRCLPFPLISSCTLFSLTSSQPHQRPIDHSARHPCEISDESSSLSSICQLPLVGRLHQTLPTA